MKKILLLISVWLTPSRGYAEPAMDVALKGGVDSATLSKGYRVSRYGPTGGLAGGLEWPLAARFSLAGQLELLYTPRGGEAVIEDVSQGKIHQQYLDIRIVVRPRVRLPPLSGYLLLGGGVSFLMSADDVNAGGFSKDVTDELNRIDMQLLVGAGIALDLPRTQLGPFHLGTLSLEVRHERGLIEVDPMASGFKNRTTSMLLGLSLVLGSGRAAQPSTANTK